MIVRLSAPPEGRSGAMAACEALRRRGLTVEWVEPEATDGSEWTLASATGAGTTAAGTTTSAGSPAFDWPAVLARTEPRDVLVGAGSGSRPLAALQDGAKVGVAGRLRRALLGVHRPGLEPVELEMVGAVADALREESIDAAVLPAAAARQIGLSGRVTEAFEPTAWLTPAGQDVLVLRPPAGWEDRGPVPRELVDVLEDAGTRAALTAELAVLSALESDAGSPVGVLARPHGHLLRIRAMVAEPRDRRLVRAEISDHVDDAEEAGRRIAAMLLERGAGALLR